MSAFADSGANGAPDLYYIRIAYYDTNTDDGFKTVIIIKNQIISQIKRILSDKREYIANGGFEMISMYIPDQQLGVGYFIFRIYFARDDMEHDWRFSGRAMFATADGIAIGNHIMKEAYKFKNLTGDPSRSDHGIKTEMMVQALYTQGVSFTFPRSTRNRMATYATTVATLPAFIEQHNSQEHDQITMMSSVRSDTSTVASGSYSKAALSNISHASAASIPVSQNPTHIFDKLSEPPLFNETATQLIHRLTDHGAKVYDVKTGALVETQIILDMYAVLKAFDTHSDIKYSARKKDDTTTRAETAIYNQTIFVDTVSSKEPSDLSYFEGCDVYGFALKSRPDVSFPVVKTYSTKSNAVDTTSIIIQMDWHREQPNVDALAIKVMEEKIHPLHAVAMKFSGDNLVGILHHQKKILNEKFDASIDAEILTWTHDVRAALLNGVGHYPIFEESGLVIKTETHLSAFAAAGATSSTIRNQEDRLTMVLFLNQPQGFNATKKEQIEQLLREKHIKDAKESMKQILENRDKLFKKFIRNYNQYIRSLTLVLLRLLEHGIRNPTTFTDLKSEFNKLKNQMESILHMTDVNADDNADDNTFNFSYYFPGNELDASVDDNDDDYEYLTLLHDLARMNRQDIPIPPEVMQTPVDDIIKKVEDSNIQNQDKRASKQIKFIDTPNPPRAKTKKKPIKKPINKSRSSVMPSETKLGKRRNEMSSTSHDDKKRRQDLSINGVQLPTTDLVREYTKASRFNAKQELQELQSPNTKRKRGGSKIPSRLTRKKR
jgi:hypothetical protein